MVMVIGDLVLKVEQVIILTVLNAKNQKLVICDLVLKVRQVLKARFDCILFANKNVCMDLICFVMK